MELGIAHVGLGNADSHRLRTISGMAATSGVLKHRWVMSEPATADLVVVSADSWDGVSMVRSSANGYRQIIAVLAGESDAVPDGCLKLHWPIRLENLVSLLGIVEGKAEKAGNANVVKLQPPARPIHAGKVERKPGVKAVAAPDSGASAQSPLVRLASILREGAVAGPDTLWRVLGIGKQPLFIAPAEKLFYFNESLVCLTVGPESPLGISSIACHEAGTLKGEKPLQMLQWLVGLKTGSMGLLPWIDGKRAIQLTRYPPFPILHHTPAHRRIAAVLSHPCTDVETVTRLTGSDSNTVMGFVNAVSLCGFLASVEPMRTPATPPGGAGKPAVNRSLFQSFRRALGIASGND